MRRASTGAGAGGPPQANRPSIDPRQVRILIDEDLPSGLAEQLRSRGLESAAINELRESIWTGQTSISDDDVCQEAARTPTVLVTLNVRDYADPAFVSRMTEEYGVSVVVVRPPKRESTSGKRAAAIRDIVHRQAHKIGPLYNEPDPVVVSANRASFRKRAISDIVAERKRRESEQ